MQRAEKQLPLQLAQVSWPCAHWNTADSKPPARQGFPVLQGFAKSCPICGATDGEPPAGQGGKVGGGGRSQSLLTLWSCQIHVT